MGYEPASNPYFLKTTPKVTNFQLNGTKVDQKGFVWQQFSKVLTTITSAPIYHPNCFHPLNQNHPFKKMHYNRYKFSKQIFFCGWKFQEIFLMPYLCIFLPSSSLTSNPTHSPSLKNIFCNFKAVITHFLKGGCFGLRDENYLGGKLVQM